LEKYWKKYLEEMEEIFHFTNYLWFCIIGLRVSKYEENKVKKGLVGKSKNAHKKE
jgi:Holliday junction resolvasome RuvABC endonuclease subunit